MGGFDFTRRVQMEDLANGDMHIRSRRALWTEGGFGKRPSVLKPLFGLVVLVALAIGIWKLVSRLISELDTTTLITLGAISLLVVGAGVIGGGFWLAFRAMRPRRPKYSLPPIRVERISL